MSTPVIAAIDFGPSTSRVLFHAAAFARLLQVQLKVMHVSTEPSPELRERLLNACLQLGPYEVDFDDDHIVLRAGRVSEAIAQEAVNSHASLIVIGSRGHGGISKLLLGSTSESVLKIATTPVLLVPPTDIDIAAFDDGVSLTCGPVVAAIDLTDDTGDQLRLAGKVAEIARQPLMLMTVARSRVTDHEATDQLRELAHGLAAPKPRALIVRRGAIAEEISRCAAVEGAGLVVMGLRESPRRQPGAIASAVLRTRRAFVLAVPTARAEKARRPRARVSAMAMIAAMLLAFAPAAAVSGEQREWANAPAIAAFQRAADTYAFLHRQVERQLGAKSDGARELAAAIVAARGRSPEPLFSPAAVTEFRSVAARAVRAGCDAGELRTGVWDLTHPVNGSASGTSELSACMTQALPPLPAELEYRSAGTVLLVVDRHANLVVDVLPALLAGSTLR